MPTIYGNNPKLLTRAKRSSQPVSGIGKAARPGSGKTPKGHLDSHLCIDQEMVERMAHQVDPLTGKPQQTGPAHLRARLAGRPRYPDKGGATSQ